MGRIVVVSNPKSRVNRSQPRLVGELAEILGDREAVEQPADLVALDHTIARLHEQGVDTLAVNGGDGTLHKVLSAVVRRWSTAAGNVPFASVKIPQIVLLKSGTVNTMARNVGVGRRARPMLAALVAAVREGRPVRTVYRTPVVVNRTHAGFLFGTGVLSRYMEMYYAGGNPGPAKALWLVAQVCASAAVGGPLARALFALDPARVEVDDRVWVPDRYAAIAIGGVNDLGLGFKLFHSAAENPGRLHALGFPCAPVEVLKVMPQIYLGRPTRSPHIIDEMVQRVLISGPAARGFMMDGDFLPGGEQLLIEAGPPVPFLLP
jgi:diacylglycerol kinase (ATP)